MGGAKAYNPGGGFSSYEFRQDGGTINVGGVSAKVIVKIDDDSNHSGLPVHSNTPGAIYVKVDGSEKKPIQIRVYEGRTASFDLDWGHTHDASHPKGVVHVQFFDKDGKRSTKKVRFMNNEEMKKYGPILRYLNPDVKFRP